MFEVDFSTRGNDAIYDAVVDIGIFGDVISKTTLYSYNAFG